MKRTLLAVLSCAIFGCGEGSSSDDPAGPEVLGTVETTPEPQPELVKALDISVWSGTITAAHVQGWKSAGYSHVVVGTQNTSIAKQQLEMCVAGGMTVDVYIYLSWSVSMLTQVQKAKSIAGGKPVRQIWLDLEDDPGSLDVYDIHAKIQQAVDACAPYPVGIYTGWFWRNHMKGSAGFSDLPLWYANYNNLANFDDWDAKSFGGWTTPVGKQFMGNTTAGGNGVDVDKNIMWLNLKGPLPAAAGTPAPPSGLEPDDVTLATSSAALTWSNVGATKYQILMEFGSPGAWKYYWTWTATTPTFKVWPQTHGKTYRWRVRGRNATGWGDWSAWAQFQYP